MEEREKAVFLGEAGSVVVVGSRWRPIIAAQ
jgi:hypothetical protein